MLHYNVVFQVGQFHDDRHGSRLRTLISHYPPAQVFLHPCLLRFHFARIFENSQVTIDDQ